MNLDVLDSPLWDAWLSTLHYPALSVSDEIGLFSALSACPLAREKLSEVLQIGDHACDCLVTLLSALGFLAKKDGMISLQPVAREYLLPSSVLYWGGMLAGSREKPEHKRIREAIRLSNPTLKHEGKSLTEMWESGSITPEAARSFTQAMHSQTYGPALRAAATGCFDGVQRLLDVGAGSGCFSIALAKKYPNVHFGIFDLPVVCEIAAEYAQREGLTKQIHPSPGNFFTDEFPKGYDGLLFSNIFHDWGRDRCQTFANLAYAALEKGGADFYTRDAAPRE